jgi:2-dehydropantoate 2-reductase
VIERVCVAGAGVIGSLFAGHLAQVADVCVLTRREEHARALNDEGLRVSGRSDLRSRVLASTDPAALPEPDLVLVCSKGTDLPELARRMAGHFGDATMMTVQNGLGADEIVAAQGSWPILTSVTFMSGTRHLDTHVEYILDTATWIGPSRDTTPAHVQAVVELIRSSGLKAEGFADLRPALWSKLIFNATVNTVAALTGLPHEPRFARLDDPGDLGHLVRALMDEGKAVAATAGVELREDPWEMNVHATERGSWHYPSMLEDVDAHRPTEIELITGALVREGRRLGVPVPLHETMYRLIKAKEASWGRPG